MSREAARGLCVFWFIMGDEIGDKLRVDQGGCCGSDRCGLTATVGFSCHFPPFRGLDRLAPALHYHSDPEPMPPKSACAVGFGSEPPRKKNSSPCVIALLDAIFLVPERVFPISTAARLILTPVSGRARRGRPVLPQAGDTPKPHRDVKPSPRGLECRNAVRPDASGPLRAVR